jgi:RNA polymerase sigma-70 factor (ECF subfamily)
MTEDVMDTVDLLAKLRAGDGAARDRLVERCVPPLRRWARGRLPQWARGLCDTQDLVQDVILRSLPGLASFEPRHPGALLMFLQRAVKNRVVDEVRKAQHHPGDDAGLDTQPDLAPSPLEQAILHECLEKYAAALSTLEPDDQQIISARFEQHQSYADIAVALGRPNANAARMSLNRAIARLLRAMASNR